MRSNRKYVQRWIEQFPLDVDESLKTSLGEFSPSRVTLVTFGTGWNRDTKGLDCLTNLLDKQDVFSGKDDIKSRILNCTHRLENIFDHCDRLESRGRYWSAQADFIHIYRRHFGDQAFHQYFRAMFLMIHDTIEDTFFEESVLHLISCRHGHHRSQAFAELLAGLLRHHWLLRVDVWHIDDSMCELPDRVLNSLEFETHFKTPLIKALTPPFYYKPLHYRLRLAPKRWWGGSQSSTQNWHEPATWWGNWTSWEEVRENEPEPTTWWEPTPTTPWVPSSWWEPTSSEEHSHAVGTSASAVAFGAMLYRLFMSLASFRWKILNIYCY